MTHGSHKFWGVGVGSQIYLCFDAAEMIDFGTFSDRNNSAKRAHSEQE